jgi:hypothetical protein
MGKVSSYWEHIENFMGTYCCFCLPVFFCHFWPRLLEGAMNYGCTWILLGLRAFFTLILRDLTKEFCKLLKPTQMETSH